MQVRIVYVCELTSSLLVLVCEHRQPVLRVPFDPNHPLFQRTASYQDSHNPSTTSHHTYPIIIASFVTVDTLNENSDDG
jgi:hypothetical protein